MGAVYLATDQRFGSMVALKETFFTDSTLRKAFEREARLLNRLRHPALPNVSDHFVEDEGQFLVMEFITGEDLSEMLKEQGGAFPLKEVLGWADQLLDALDYLHTQESPVIHRDIKPQNLKLTPRGQIILLDFGLAKGTPLHVSQVTQSGSLFGYSKHYAPIEQIQGTGTDTRSDLYSLAATLYHLMTGTTPPDALTRAASVLNGQPDPLRPANEVHGQVTHAVAQVLMSAMSQNAGQRPQTAMAMREALTEAGKQTLIAGSITNAHAVAGTLLEQDTQLIESQSVDAATSADARKDEPGSILAFQQPTNIDSGAATSTRETDASTRLDNPKSELTQVASASRPKRMFSGRAIGIAAGSFILVVVAVVVFAMTRQPTTLPVEAPIQSDTNNSNSNSSLPQQSNSTQSDNAPKTLPKNTQEASAESSEPPSRTPKSNVTPAPSKPPPNVPTSPPPPQNNAGTNPYPPDPRNPDNRNWTREQIANERRRVRMMQRQAEAEKKRALRERRRAEALRRQQQYGQP